MVATIEGGGAGKVIKVLYKIPEKVRDGVEEITLDMANFMGKMIRSRFQKANRFMDRFLVQKRFYDALQEIRIVHKWNAINEETNTIENSKAEGKDMSANPNYTIMVFSLIV
ncbi:transposase [Maribellus sp. YY47]|uniref:transposase n=1 Tax=Maribellus sp. YY47 TaxID=2929486 RepID=UPI00200074D4|nr:transposase [Maribellus sp. YY47]MCK3684364.1 transposase [Maribellus sp. YY47]